jgi:hypothetical protein
MRVSELEVTSRHTGASSGSEGGRAVAGLGALDPVEDAVDAVLGATAPVTMDWRYSSRRRLQT